MPTEAQKIRDETAARFANLTRYFPEGRPGGPARVKRTFLLPTQDEEVPCILVYVPGDAMAADGDYNAGQPSFDHSTRIAVSCLVKADDPETLDAMLDEAAEEVMQTLLTDPTWLGLFSGVTAIERAIRPTTEEKPRYLMAQSLLVFTIAFASDWPPKVTDSLSGITMRTPTGRGAGYAVPQT